MGERHGGDGRARRRKECHGLVCVWFVQWNVQRGIYAAPEMERVLAWFNHPTVMWAPLGWTRAFADAWFRSTGLSRAPSSRRGRLPYARAQRLHAHARARAFVVEVSDVREGDVRFVCVCAQRAAVRLCSLHTRMHARTHAYTDADTHVRARTDEVSYSVRLCGQRTFASSSGSRCSTASACSTRS